MVIGWFGRLIMDSMWVVMAVLVMGANSYCNGMEIPESAPVLRIPVEGLSVESIEAGRRVFSAEEEWLVFWAEYGEGAAPLVDFNRWKIVAVFAGAQPNPGYGIEIIDYEMDDRKIKVKVVDWRPHPGMFYAAVLVWPYDIVAVPTAEVVSFEMEERLRPIERPRVEPLVVRPLEVKVSTAAPAQYTAFTDADSWLSFWRRYGEGEAPAVFFDKEMVVGAINIDGIGPEAVVAATRRDGIFRITLRANPEAPRGYGVFEVMPRARRVEIALIGLQND